MGYIRTNPPREGLCRALFKAALYIPPLFKKEGLIIRVAGVNAPF